MQRRVFLRSGAMALVTIGLSPSFLRRAAFAASLPSPRRGKILICLFQRGAADSLNIVVPHGEAAYHTLRPTIGIARPGTSGAESALDLDGFFGLHPALSALHPLWRRGLLAPVHAVGSPSSTRSHFDAQDYLETGTPDVKGTPDGWLNRYLAVHGTCEACARPSAFRAVALSPTSPRILAGEAPALAMASIADFTIRADPRETAQLEALYRAGPADLIHGTGAETFEAVRMLRAADPARYAPANGARYPASRFGRSLQQIAQLIRSNVGVEIAFADVGGWDTHIDQGGATGQLANRLRDFGDAIAALVTDLGDRMEDVVIVTMSEFGRMARQNGDGGTDHGHAGALFLIGGPVRGGKVHGRWPGLEHDQLYQGRDLALTTDFRAVFSEVLATHLGAPAASADRIFPGFGAPRSEWVGVLGQG